MSPRLCPSCRTRLSPFALECPVCGLTLERPPLPRPLLFQASALHQRTEPSKAPPRAIAAPALGRVSPLPAPDEEILAPTPKAPALPQEPPPSPMEDEDEPSAVSLWPIVAMETLELLSILILNALLLAVVCVTTRLSPTVLYASLGSFLLLLHLIVSWAYVMVPLTLTGQSLFMARLGWMLAAVHPEKRLAFSVFHLLSALLLPISIVSVVFVRGNRTLAERLTGQELIPVPSPRLRG